MYIVGFVMQSISFFLKEIIYYLQNHEKEVVPVLLEE